MSRRTINQHRGGAANVSDINYPGKSLQQRRGQAWHCAMTSAGSCIVFWSLLSTEPDWKTHPQKACLCSRSRRAGAKAPWGTTGLYGTFWRPLGNDELIDTYFIGF